MRLLTACSRCGVAKPPSEFYDRQDRASSRPHCRQCAIEAARQWNEDNPARRREIRLRYLDRNRQRNRERSKAYRERQASQA